MHSRVDRAIRARRGVRSKNMQAGHTIGYTENPASGKVHVAGSMVAALGAGLDPKDGIHENFVRYCKIAGRGRRNILFLVDTSGSMISSGKLSYVKGCVVSLLQDAYVSRTRVGIVGYGGATAQVILPFTSSAEMAARRIDEALGGGATPLLDAFALAIPLIEGVGSEPVEVVLLSDGGYLRPRGVAAKQAIRNFAAYCQRRNVPIFFVDSGSGRKTSKQRAKRLAALLHTDYHQLSDLRASAFV